MSDSSLNFTESQIRALISSLFYIGKKNSGSLPISSTTEAAEIVAYCAGFDSWKSLKQSLRVRNSFFNYSPEYSHPDFINVDKITKEYSQAENLIFSTSKLKDFESKINLRPYALSNNNYNEIAENHQSATGMLIAGEYYNEEYKYDSFFHLNPQNTLCISHDTVFYSKFLKQAKDREKHHVIFSSTTASDNFSEDYKTICLDPLNDVYCSDHFDLLFGLSYEDSSSFDVLWSLIVKDFIIQNSFTLTPSFLKYSLSLEFLCFYLLSLKKNKSPLVSLLGKYLNGLNIQIKENVFSFTPENALKHISKIEDIYLKVLHLEHLYQKGVFATTSRATLLSYFRSRELLVIKTPSEVDSFTSHLFSVTVDYALDEYDKECERKNYKHLNYQILLAHNDPQLFLNPSLYHKNYSYHIRNANSYDSMMNYFSQILFTKLNSSASPSQDWLIKFYTNTENITNLFAFQNSVLNKMESNEAYLWQKTEKHPVTSLDIFKMFLLKPLNKKLLET